ncbi:hypothetical protein G6321_00039520 [Bradyrhizobium barranii subsp. barranii]|uniref:Uncharacterized protein n=1 Tax=Bradyrhizobium barranii subsp. barranii TaxID=2823807 RepID=A0A7Z0QD13_9BRAD|nr:MULTISPECIES: hypothetical protein [Bradyrhizobium]UEM17961.1 hypothetical protein J4G43_053100 [Bradyrhizobium barranii subsp. barranii]UGX91781.1 hypothetical protein G6321_00039520 [Bradyrhizobium barranii subsp. barranii]UQE03590.1 hypothetical protein JEY30_47510 [Bradyrhizobium japonicum]
MKAKTVTETRAEIRGMVAKLDEICKADVRKHAAKKKPSRGARLRQAEASVKDAKPRDRRLVFKEMDQ